MKIKTILSLVLAAMLFAACDDTTDTIGSSLTPDIDKLQVEADTFTVTSRTILADSVVSRNSTGYLGRVKDPETDDVIKASFMTQFHTLSNFELPTEDEIYSRDDDGEIIADSCELELVFDDYYGDSLAQMKLRAYLMDTPMEEGQYYSTSYDPIEAGNVSSSSFYQDQTYSLCDQTISDEERDTSTYVKNIRIKLNKPFTKDGVTYNNLGTYIMRQYYANPDNFHNNYQFIHNIIPGFYIENTGGLGSMAYVTTPLLAFYFKYGETSDSILAVNSSFAGTEEVLQTTTFSTSTDRLKELAANTSCTYLKSPSGLYTEVTLPVEEIMYGHENDTINTARLNIPRIVNQSPTEYTLDIPSNVIMLPEDSLYSFFANSSLPNYKTSFISSYSSSSNSYLFGNISGMVNAMYKAYKSGNASENWNKVVILPVTLETATTSSGSTSTVGVTPDMSLTSTRLLGGDDNPDALKITVIYSKFNAE